MFREFYPDEPGCALLEDVLQIRGGVVALIYEVNVDGWPQYDFVGYSQVVIRLRECRGVLLRECGIGFTSYGSRGL